jgi:hypothetical protein
MYVTPAPRESAAKSKDASCWAPKYSLRYYDAYYRKALQARTVIKSDFINAWIRWIVC